MQKTDKQLVNLFGKLGKFKEISGNQPWEITNCNDAFAVEQGQVQLFLFDTKKGIEGSKRTYMGTVSAPGMIPGMIRNDSTAGHAGVLAVASPGTVVQQVPLETLEDMIKVPKNKEIRTALDNWVNQIEKSLGMPPVPRNSIGLEIDKIIGLKAGDIAHAPRMMVWLDVHEGVAKLINLFDIKNRESDKPYPLAQNSWIVAETDCTIAVKKTETIAEEKLIDEGLERLHQHMLVFLDNGLKVIEAHDRELIKNRIQLEKDKNSLALDSLASIIEKAYNVQLEIKKGDPYLMACRKIGEIAGIDIKPAPEREQNLEGRLYVLAIAKSSNVRARDITLYEGWWKDETGPMLGFLRDTNTPVALIPYKGKGFYYFNPVTMENIRIDHSNADHISINAYAFYRPFPFFGLNGKDVFKYALKNIKPDLTRIALTAIIIGLIGMLAPIITGKLFSEVVPKGERGTLIQLSVFLMGSALATMMIQVAQNISVLRIEAKAGSELQSALWDRLLALPASFFRRYTAGELSQNAMGFDTLRQIMAGTVVSSIIAFFSSIFSFFLLFKFSLSLAFIAMVLTVITVGIVITSTLIQIRYQLELTKVHAKISGFIFQLLGGITKLKIAGAEGRALEKWSEQFSIQKKISNKARLTDLSLSTFNSTWRIITSMIIFFYISRVLGGRSGITAGEFLAFSAAFGQFFGAMMSVAGIVSSLAQAGPIYKLVTPILSEVPEVTPDMLDPGTLQGHIELAHIKFRYDEKLPYVLNDVNLDIKPGEFIALVGPSGTGKSSLFRLLLGFEKAENGTIYYDRQDIKTLDIQAVRKQIGVVIQSAALTPGDIFTNIVGSQPYTIDDAWEAAAMAGFDEDVKRMPMGMHTYISEGEGSISGGQKQRLLIARALIGKPKILFFDEATSALDNETQAIVTESIDKLLATRIVIAHRLSTIERADRIIVLNNGHFEQMGTYTELMSQPGLFQELAKRQLA